MKKRFKLIILISISILFFILSSINSITSADIQSYKNFQIEDFSWLDDKDMALYLKGATCFYQNMYDTKNLSFDAASIDYDDRNQLSFNFSPDYLLKYITLGNEVKLNIPFSLSYYQSLYPSEDKDFDINQKSIQNYRDNKSKNLSMNLSPELDYKKYFNNFSFESISTINISRTYADNENIYSYYYDNYYSKSNYSINKNEQNNYSDNNSWNFSISEIIKIGKGRKYDGTYAYHSMQIIEDLNNEGLLLNTVSQEDMKKLSKIIARERRKYSLDYRKATIEAVEKVADFLLKNSYIKSNNLKSILIIDDSYKYMPNILNRFRPSILNRYRPNNRYTLENSREFGKTYNLRIGGNYSISLPHSYSSNRSYSQYTMYTNNGIEQENMSTNINTSLIDTKNQTYQLFIGGELNYYKPISQKWQFNTSFILDGFILDKDFGTSEITNSNQRTKQTYEINKPFHMMLQINLSLTFLASTRVYFMLNNFIKLDYFKLKNYNKYYESDVGTPVKEYTESYKEFYFSDDVYFSIIYELNYNFTINFSIGLNYVLRKQVDYQVTGNIFEDSYYPTIDDLNDFLKEDDILNNLYWSVNLSISYRLF